MRNNKKYATVLANGNLVIPKSTIKKLNLKQGMKLKIINIEQQKKEEQNKKLEKVLSNIWSRTKHFTEEEVKTDIATAIRNINRL